MTVLIAVRIYYIVGKVLGVYEHKGYNKPLLNLLHCWKGETFLRDLQTLVSISVTLLLNNDLLTS